MGCSGCSDSNEDFMNFYVDTDDFNEKGNAFSVFIYNFYYKENQNIKKVFSELLMENNKPVVKKHKIFITRNFQLKTTQIIQIEIVEGEKPKKHLINQKTGECSIETLIPYIEKYNDIFQIDTTEWYDYLEKKSDIYVKSEKDYQNVIKTFVMFYKKDKKILNYISTDNSRGTKSNIKPNEVVNLYNELRASFEVDNEPQSFYYKEEIPYYNIRSNNSNYKNVIKNNNSYNSNNNNNSYYNYSNNQSKSSASMRNKYGNHIGSVGRNGEIRNEMGNKIGSFESNGDINDEYGNRVGRIESDGEIKDEMGNRIGQVESDGDVKDEYGNRIGEIESDGDVKDEYGNIIGNAEGMDRDEAAYMYFFNNNNNDDD